MYGYLGYFGAVKTAVGPKQQACLASGGSWQGPVGKKKCVTATAGAPTGATGGAIPKAGTTIMGPIPAEYVGTEKKGAAGPKQLACKQQGGSWIGPEGKRWCQIPPGPGIPATTVSKDTGLVDTAVVPPDSHPSSGELPQAGGDTPLSPDMAMQQGLQTEAGGAPSGAVYSAGMLPGNWPLSQGATLFLAAAAAGAFFYWKYRKGKHGRRRR
jgi:hypothetical protein